MAHPVGPMRNLDKYLLGALGLYLVAGFLLIGAFRYQINPDALSYISIAQHYRDGFWGDAINAYWSPLYSWLLLPLLFFGLEPLLAAKIVNLALGFVGTRRVLAPCGYRGFVHTLPSNFRIRPRPCHSPMGLLGD